MEEPNEIDNLHNKIEQLEVLSLYFYYFAVLNNFSDSPFFVAHYTYPFFQALVETWTERLEKQKNDHEEEMNRTRALIEALRQSNLEAQVSN